VIDRRTRRCLALGLLLAAAGCREDPSAQPPLHAPPVVAPATRAERRLDAALAPASPIDERPGLAAVVLIDVSGSMEQRIRGERTQKIEVARRAALDLVEQFVRYAADHPKETVQLSVAEFSARDGQDDVREVIRMGPPDLERARTAIAAMRADGGTPIGSAVIHAKRTLDATGLARRHLLVVTDGENTTGEEPADVVAAIGRRPELERPSVYFVAFDIDASRFDDVRSAGGLVLAAGSGKALGETLDSLLRGRILVEK
jgi:Mg-chelatase subunit ChlD